jgi:hypothetical protein
MDWQLPAGTLLEHAVVFDRRHLIRLVRSYLVYYDADRCHLGLGKDAPSGRRVTPRPTSTAKVGALRRVDGLDRRYAWREAA